MIYAIRERLLKFSNALGCFSYIHVSYLEASCLLHWKWAALPLSTHGEEHGKCDKGVYELFDSQSWSQRVHRIPTSIMTGDRG